MANVTFRDFAGAVMSGNAAAAASVLETLLALEAATARDATSHFQAQMATGGPAFMQKAMSLRTAVASGSDAEIGALLTDLFGLADPARARAIATLRTPAA